MSCRVDLYTIQPAGLSLCACVRLGNLYNVPAVVRSRYQPKPVRSAGRPVVHSAGRLSRDVGRAEGRGCTFLN